MARIVEPTRLGILRQPRRRVVPNFFIILARLDAECSFSVLTCAMPANHSELEHHLWEAADELRANSKLKSSEYSVPLLGLIFLKRRPWRG